MKEVKFRVFDIINKEFANDFTIDLDGNLLCDEGATLFIREHFKISRYTGLKDKNGKEIYEGDIVTYRDIGGFEVEYEYECLYNIQKYRAALIVIGNIYENPGLLYE